VVALGNHRYTYTSLLGRQLMSALLAIRPPVAAPRRIVPTPATLGARILVEGLLASWDDAVAADAFAMNVDLDEPLERRRAEIERLRGVHGRLEADPDEPQTSLSSFDLTWWLRGERGRVKVELLLSPEPEPRIQALTLTSAPEPPADLSDLAAVVVTAISDGPWGSLPDPLTSRLASAVDQVALERAIRAAGARFGPVRLDAVTGGTEHAATWRLRGDRGDLTLRLERDPATGACTAVEVNTVDVEPPIHAV
jgi:hypothetical protein